MASTGPDRAVGAGMCLPVRGAGGEGVGGHDRHGVWDDSVRGWAELPVRDERVMG